MNDLRATAKKFAELDARLSGRDPTDAEADEWIALSKELSTCVDSNLWPTGKGWSWVKSLRHAVAAILAKGSA